MNIKAKIHFSPKIELSCTFQGTVIHQQQKKAPKGEHTPTTVGFHFVHLLLQAEQSFQMFTSATSAAGKRSKSPAQPDAPNLAPGKDLWTQHHQVRGLAAFRGPYKGHNGIGCSVLQFVFIDVLLMFFEEKDLWLAGFAGVSIPHSTLWQNVTQKYNYISSSPIPANLKMMVEFLLAEENKFIHKYFPQHWLYPSVDQI